MTRVFHHRYGNRAWTVGQLNEVELNRNRTDSSVLGSRVLSKNFLGGC